jgi:hypothetical protein
VSKSHQGLVTKAALVQNEIPFANHSDYEISWNEFEGYLSVNLTKHTAKCRVLYAKRYANVLRECNAQDLLLLSEEKRLHVMKSLAALSKYLGGYDIWKDIMQRYQLKWSDNDTLQTFKNMTNSEKDYESMTDWLENTLSRLPTKYGNILLYDTLTGLRPEEACKSISLIHKCIEEYLNKKSFVLEHFRFPGLFIRRTKKAYISLASEPIINIAIQCSNCGYNSLRLAIKRRGLDMHMAYCRKIFATHLRMNGIEQETIDLLQGRTPKSVFAKHYFRPGSNYERIRESLGSLLDSLKSHTHLS